MQDMLKFQPVTMAEAAVTQGSFFFFFFFFFGVAVNINRKKSVAKIICFQGSCLFDLITHKPDCANPQKRTSANLIDLWSLTFIVIVSRKAHGSV